jgi:hypothetical protein
MRATPLLAATLLAVSGCHYEADLGDHAADSGTAATTLPANPRKLDLLFVIDNSGSMEEEQVNLAANFSRFMDALEPLSGGLPDLHIAVVSSDVGIGYTAGGCSLYGDNGRFQVTPRVQGCEPPAGAFLVDVEGQGGERERNVEGTLGDAFTCIARLGTTGCGLEQHLEATMRGLDGRNPENLGFLRADAFLAIVILADEDDCSAFDTAVFDPDVSTIPELGPFASFRCTEFGITCDGGEIAREPAEYQSCEPRGDSYLRHSGFYADFLRSLKEDPRAILVGVIAGQPEPVAVTIETSGAQAGYPRLLPSCQSAHGAADPAVRLDHFARSFGARGTFTSICQDDLSPAIDAIARKIYLAMSGELVDEEEPAPEPDPGADTSSAGLCHLAPGGRAPAAGTLALLLLALAAASRGRRRA